MYCCRACLIFIQKMVRVVLDLVAEPPSEEIVVRGFERLLSEPRVCCTWSRFALGKGDCRHRNREAVREQIQICCETFG